MKFITPAIASEPYWAAAPSRKTSTCLIAEAGITEISGPWAPSDKPPPKKVITALRWRRLPLTNTKVWSDAKPRKLAGRTSVEASLIGWSFTLNDGTTFCKIDTMSEGPWLAISEPSIISTGTAESATDLGAARVPTIEIFSTSCSSAAGCCCA